TKSHYYVARTAQVYRRAIDMAAAGQPFDDKSLMAELEHLANRGYTEGFYRRHVPQEYQNYEQGSSSITSQRFVGEIRGVDSDRGWMEVEVKNRFERGDTVELMTPRGNAKFAVEAIENLEGASMEAAPGVGHVVKVPLPEEVRVEDGGRFALLVRHLGDS
ncbi:MAG TPA: U32 family peptidase C-terminal domain-containing protein, partial [Porticoccaceae bacterium]